MLMAHEAEIIIPGSFVVLQGNAGDGMSNTIDDIPIEEVDSGHPPLHSSSSAYTQPTELDDVDEEDDDESSNIAEVSMDDPEEGGFQHVEDVRCVEDHEEDGQQKLPAMKSLNNGIRSNVSHSTTTNTNAPTRMVGLGQLTSQRQATPTVALNRWTQGPSSATAKIETDATTSSSHASSGDDSFVVVTDQKLQSSSEGLGPRPNNGDRMDLTSGVCTGQATASKPPPSSPGTNGSRKSRQSGEDCIISSSTAQAIERWQVECRNREIRQRREWKQANMEQQQQLRQQERQQLETSPVESSIASMLSILGGDSSGGTNMPIGSVARRCSNHGEAQVFEGEEWWHFEGQVAVLKDVPTTKLLLTQTSEASLVADELLRRRVVVRNVIGTLGPGTTIVAMELLYLNSHTLERVDAAKTTGTEGSIHGAHLIYPRGRPGLVQLLKFEYQSSQNNNSSPGSSSCIAYCVLSLDGYPLLTPGLPSLYVDPHVSVWRVTCPAGAYVREGLDLNTRHIDTIPFGSLVRVTRKTVNSMGLSRLRVQALVDDTTISTRKSSSSKKSSLSQARVVDGWCSEFLNPLSGQRGVVASPVPFPVPALYRVTLAVGAVIRRSVELSSPQIGVAPMGATLKIVKRAFSDHPMENCIERLQLAGNGGWISVRLNRPPPANDMVVQFVGIDGTFEPNFPGRFHIQAARTVQQEQSTTTGNPNSASSGGMAQSDGGRVASTSAGHNGEFSSTDDSRSHSNSTGTGSVDGRGAPTIRRTAPNTSRASASESCLYPGGPRDGNTENYKCLICLTEERNATIVHGETGHVACCLVCARILKARGDKCPVCRLNIDLVIQQFWA